MATTIVDRLHSEFSELITLLRQSQEISLISSAEDNFKKSLLLAAASYFENRLSNFVTQFACESAGDSHIMTQLVINKAVKRQYHTWFNWEDKNANAFFALFGSWFSTQAKDIVKNTPELDLSIKAFLELGNNRNRLVHQDFGSFTLEKTTEEIYELYQRASVFVEWVPTCLRDNSAPAPAGA